MVRCSEFGRQARFSVCKFTGLKTLSQRPRLPAVCSSCVKLHSLLHDFTIAPAGLSARAAPVAARHAADKEGVGRLFKGLRQTEAAEAHRENMTIKLGSDVNVHSNIEGNGTVLSKFYVSRNNPRVQHLIEDAEKGFKRRGKKSYGKIQVWAAPVRFAALAERAGGRITITKLSPTPHLRLLTPSRFFYILDF